MPEDENLFYTDSETSEYIPAPTDEDDTIGTSVGKSSPIVSGQGVEEQKDSGDQGDTEVVEDEPLKRTISASLIGELGVAEDDEVKPEQRTVSSALVGDLSVDDDDDSDSTLYSPEERLSTLGDCLLSATIVDSSVKRYAIDKLLMLPSPNIFRNENFVIFSVYYNYRGKLRFLNIDEEFLKLYLNRNRQILQKAGNIIDINAYGEIDGFPELGYIGGVLKHYKRLGTLDPISESEFDLALEKYLIEFKTMEAERAFQQSQTILVDGLTIGRKKYFGFNDSQNFIKRKLAEIEGLVNMSSGSGFRTSKEILTEEKEQNKSYKVGDFGKLSKLNEVYGGIYTGLFYQVIAPPKSGKSKFMARLAWIMTVVYGNNITVWADEGGSNAFMAQIRAIHFDYIFNTGVDLKDKKLGVSQDAILHDKFPNEELKALELSSKLDLASNENYGVIDFIDRPLDLDNYIDDLDTSVKSNNSVAVIVDYLQHMSTDNEVLATAYKRSLDYCEANNIAFLTPGQYKQESFDKLLDMKDTSGADMRTAGGGTKEVIMTPDILFAFWATTVDLANNRLKILSMPCRYNKPFPEIDVAINYESCQFMDLVE